ncbi:MAG: serine hydrolase [Candidatus Levybacteria bacterium]|nr:serine hydrolase [Candidatus Levybacteria bacterium]
MKKSWILILLMLTIVFFSVEYLFFNPIEKNKKNIPMSPLPEFLTILKNNQVSSLSLFLPNIEIKPSSLKKPDIEAKSVFVYDLTSKMALYTKNINERLPMASLTKVMTAIISLENKKPDDRYFVRKSSLVGEDSMGLTEGEILNIDELLYGLMLSSGNDAAEVLADNYSKGRIGFVKAMNDKAKALGLKDTHFTNPSGLQGDGNQYTTAYDLFVITNYAISNFPLFNKVVSTFQYEISYSKMHKYFFLENETNLLTSYPGVKGVKTGYTPEADLCLITYLDYKGHKIIGVILGSNNRRQEMKELLDYSLKAQGIPPPPHS